MNRRFVVDTVGVLSDFISPALELTKTKIPIKDITWNFMETLLPGGRDEFWNLITEDFWAYLPWTNEGRELIKGLINIAGAENIILAVGPNQYWHSDGHVKWMRQQLPELMNQFVMTHRKEYLANSRSILLDDREHNCDQFAKFGGHALLVPRMWNINKVKCDAQGNFDVKSFLTLCRTTYNALQ
jgi:hypothetical protein